MKIEIRDRYDSSKIFFSVEADSVKEAVEEAVKKRINLRGSDLSYSNLRGSDLSYSNLRGSDLSYSNLRGSDLSHSNLSYSDLRGSNLSYSNLRGSSLSHSDLSYSNLRGSDLSYSDLRGSDLSYSNLRGSDLSYSNLNPARVDFLAEVLKLPNELEFLRDAITEGRIDGSTYSGECACLAGTLAHAKGIVGYRGGAITNGCTFVADSYSPRERFFLAIKKGDKPETNGASKIALDWTNEAISIRENIRNSIPKPL